MTASHLQLVLEHVPEPAVFLKEIYRILRPNGIIYIVVPDENALFNDFRGLVQTLRRSGICGKLDPLRSPFHVVGFTKQTLRLALESAGVQVANIRVYSGTDDHCKTILQGVRARATPYLNYHFLSETVRRAQRAVEVSVGVHCGEGEPKWEIPAKGVFEDTFDGSRRWKYCCERSKMSPTRRETPESVSVARQESAKVGGGKQQCRTK